MKVTQKIILSISSLVLLVSSFSCRFEPEESPVSLSDPNSVISGAPQAVKNSLAVNPGQWTPLMMRSREEAEAGLTGSGSEQHFHGIDRSYYYPDYIYACQDITGPWRSRDGGRTWEKTRDEGLYVNNSDSIAVDPVKPDTLFVIMDNWNTYNPQGRGGLFRSDNGGDSWIRVVAAEWEHNGGDSTFYWNNSGFSHRGYSRAIAWSPASLPLPKGTASPLRWYAALPRDYLYVSDDGGSTWSKEADLSDIEFIWDVVPDPFSVDTVYLGTEDGLLVSSDGGQTLNHLGSWTVTDFDGDGIEDNTLFPKNAGAGHDSFYDDLKIRSLKADPANPGVLRAVGFWQTGPKSTETAQRLFISTDYGEHFIEAVQPKGERHSRPVLLFQNPNPEYADDLMVLHKWGTYSYSRDGGLTWSDGQTAVSSPGLGREARWRGTLTGGISGFMHSSQDRDDITGYSRATFWKSGNGGELFSESSTGFNGIAWSWHSNGITFDRYNPNRIATFNCDVNVRITDNNWEWFRRAENIFEMNEWHHEHKLTAGQGAHAGAIQPVENAEVMISSVGQYFRVRLMRSSDGGKNWSLIDLPDLRHSTYSGTWYTKNEFYFIDFHPQHPERVWAGNLISHDAGLTWSEIDFGLDYRGEEYTAPGSIEGYCYNSPDTVYARANYMNSILRSDDGGLTWRHYNTTDTSGKVGFKYKWFDRIPSFAVNSTDPDIIYIPGGNGGLAAYNGEEWTELGLGVIDEGVEYQNFPRSIAVDPVDGHVIYVGKHKPGYSQVFRTLDGGATWEDISANLPRVGIDAIKVNPHTREVFIGSCVGTWVYPAPPGA